MNYVICLNKEFNKSNAECSNLNEIAFNDINTIEKDISNKLVGNEELQNFLYPTLTEYKEADKLKVINKTFGMECKRIVEFSKDLAMEDNMVICLLNNINNNIVINSSCNLINFYEKVYLCNLYYDNPVYNIHYIVCKNKVKPLEKIDIIVDYICMNSNLENIYTYLFSYLNSIIYLMSIYNRSNDDDRVYSYYCNNFVIT